MSVRFKRVAATMLVTPVVWLQGCAAPPPAPPVTEAAVSGPYIKLSPPQTHARRPEGCKPIRVALSTERKVELFKQFTTEVEADPALASAGSALAAPPGDSADCRQADR